MKLLTTSRNHLEVLDHLFPLCSFTGDGQRIHFNITDKQYENSKPYLPEHVIFTLPKANPSEQLKKC